MEIHEALKVAYANISQVFNDMSQYKTIITPLEGKWQIDFEPITDTTQGGGAYYTISAQTGEILLAELGQ